MFNSYSATDRPSAINGGYACRSSRSRKAVKHLGYSALALAALEVIVAICWSLRGRERGLNCPHLKAGSDHCKLWPLRGIAPVALGAEPPTRYAPVPRVSDCGSFNLPDAFFALPVFFFRAGSVDLSDCNSRSDADHGELPAFPSTSSWTVTVQPTRL